MNKVLKNTSFLFSLQMVNLLAPLLALPYLTRVFGVELFGVISATMATIVLAFVITDYGFSLSGVHRIAIAENKVSIQRILSTVVTTKLLLVVLAILFVLIILNTPSYQHYQTVFLWALPTIVAQCFQFTWFFQGLEKMGIYALYLSVSKMLYVLFVYVFVTADNVASPLMCWALANVIGTVLALYNIRKMGYSFRLTSISAVWQELKYSFYYFLSRVSVSLYVSSGPVLLGANNLNQAALYNVSDQGYKAGQAMFNPLIQAIFPFMAKNKDWHFFAKIVATFLGAIVLACLVVAQFSQEIIGFIFGAEFVSAAEIFNVLLLVLPISFLSMALGYPALSACDLIHWANRSVVLGSLFFMCAVATCFVYFNELQGVTLAYAVLLCELLVLAVRVAVLAKYFLTTSD